MRVFEWFDGTCVIVNGPVELFTLPIRALSDHSIINSGIFENTRLTSLGSITARNITVLVIQRRFPVLSLACTRYWILHHCGAFPSLVTCVGVLVTVVPENPSQSRSLVMLQVVCVGMISAS